MKKLTEWRSFRKPIKHNHHYWPCECTQIYSMCQWYLDSVCSFLSDWNRTILSHSIIIDAHWKCVHPYFLNGGFVGLNQIWLDGNNVQSKFMTTSTKGRLNITVDMIVNEKLMRSLNGYHFKATQTVSEPPSSICMNRCSSFILHARIITIENQLLI